MICQCLKKGWGMKMGVFLLVPALFAAGHAMIRPLPEGFGKKERRPAASERTEEQYNEDVVRLAELHASGAALFIDARTRREYREGHLEGAIHLPFEAFLSSGRPDVLDFMPPEIPYFVYCGGGDCDASHKVREMLETFGYFDVEVFEPGWPAIEEHGLPIVQGDGDWG